MDAAEPRHPLDETYERAFAHINAHPGRAYEGRELLPRAKAIVQGAEANGYKVIEAYTWGTYLWPDIVFVLNMGARHADNDLERVMLAVVEDGDAIFAEGDDYQEITRAKLLQLRPHYLQKMLYTEGFPYLKAWFNDHGISLATMQASEQELAEVHHALVARPAPAEEERLLERARSLKDRLLATMEPRVLEFYEVVSECQKNSDDRYQHAIANGRHVHRPIIFQEFGFLDYFLPNDLDKSFYTVLRGIKCRGIKTIPEILKADRPMVSFMTLAPKQLTEAQLGEPDPAQCGDDWRRPIGKSETRVNNTDRGLPCDRCSDPIRQGDTYWEETHYTDPTRQRTAIYHFHAICPNHNYARDIANAMARGAPRTAVSLEEVMAQATIIRRP